jgi:hypothetical protein
MSLDDVCFGIKRLALGVCLPQSEISDVDVVDAKWDMYYCSLKDDLLLIDIEISNITQHALQHCADIQTRNESYDFVFKAYEHLAALHIKFDSYYCQDMVSSASRNYIFRYIYALLFFHGLLITLVGI